MKQFLKTIFAILLIGMITVLITVNVSAQADKSIPISGLDTLDVVAEQYIVTLEESVSRHTMQQDMFSAIEVVGGNIPYKVTDIGSGSPNRLLFSQSSSNSSSRMRYAGPFLNTSLGVGGSVIIDMQVEPTTVSGYINFTDGPDVAGVLCGAGNFSGQRSGNNFSFSFISDDPEPGCHITDGLVFNINGTLSNNEIINGSFSVPSNGQSGTFNAKQTIRSNGRFFNDNLSMDGNVYVDLATWGSSVAGYINFTGDPGDPALCGANSFTGTRNGSNVTFSFLSSDPDPGCTVVDDERFNISAILSGNSLQNGIYYLPTFGQGGTFSTNGPSVDTTNPNGNITVPLTNWNISPGTHTFTADALDNSGGTGVSYVRFYIKYNGSWHYIGLDSTPPYSIRWQSPSSLTSQQMEVAIHVIDKSNNTTVDAGGRVTVNFIESSGGGVEENWVPSNKRAYLNQRSLHPAGDYKCGAAAASMVLAMNGRISNNYSSLASTANNIYQSPNYIGQVTSSIRSYGMTTGYACRTYDNAWDNIRAEIDAGRPTIVLSNKVTYGHYFVVVGYREEGNNRDIIVYDPFGRWRGISGSYYANSTSASSDVGKWVIYDFDAAFGYSSPGCIAGGYLITDHPASHAPEIIISGGITPPDPVSDETGTEITYDGVTVITEVKNFLPIISR